MNYKKSVCLAVFLAVFLIPFAYASVSLGKPNSSIQESYAPGDILTGWINLSVSNEISTSNITTNFGGKISLIDLFDYSGQDYTCVPDNCLSGYSSSNPSTSKSFQFSSSQERLLSLVLSGDISDVNSLSFDVTASNSPSCISPLKIDLFGDGSYDFIAGKNGEDYSCNYGSGTGCFNDTGPTTEVIIRNTPYCEKMNLTESNKFRLGAWVKDSESSSPEDDLLMLLYKIDNSDPVAMCNLPSPSAAGELIYCNVNYSNTEKQEYYVCIRAEYEDITRYVTLKEYPDVRPCGFYSYPGDETAYHDYYIFATAAKFENTGLVSFSQASYENLIENVKTYLDERYANTCDPSCSVPIRISSNGNVNVSFTNLSLVYSSDAGTISEKRFYDSIKSDSKLSSGFSILELDSMDVGLPTSFGNKTLLVYLNNNQIFSKKINIANVPTIKSVTPVIAPAGVTTTFTVQLDNLGNRNATKYLWDFGDGDSEETTQNFASHAYTAIDSYYLSVEVEFSDGYVTSKTFTIATGSPKEAVNLTINKYKKRLSNISVEIADFGWYKSEIENMLNITQLGDEVSALQVAYYTATNDSEYTDIMNELNSMLIPSSIRQNSVTSIPYFVDVDKINVDYLTDAGAGEASEDIEDYPLEIGKWIDANLDITLDFRYVTFYYDRTAVDALGVFTLKLQEKENYGDSVYLVVDNAGAVLEDGGVQIEGAIGKEYSSIPAEVSFVTSGDTSIGDVNVYLSPALSEISPEEPTDPCNYNGKCEQGEDWKNCRQDCRPWLWIIVLWIIVIVAGIVAYILLQWWYKVKYEVHLFKNRNEVYNIMNFISNAKSQGISDSEIVSKLKKAGWSGEQISYVSKKMRGIAIMPFAFLKFFKKKENRYITKPAVGRVGFS